MKSADYQVALGQAYLLAALIRDIDFGGALAAIEHAEAFGPMLDPTAFIRNGKKLAEDKTVVAILADAKRKLDALPWPEAKRPIGPPNRRVVEGEQPRRPHSVEQADAAAIGGDV